MKRLRTAFLAQSHDSGGTPNEAPHPTLGHVHGDQRPSTSPEVMSFGLLTLLGSWLQLLHRDRLRWAGEVQWEHWCNLGRAWLRQGSALDSYEYVLEQEPRRNLLEPNRSHLRAGRVSLAVRPPVQPHALPLSGRGGKRALHNLWLAPPPGEPIGHSRPGRPTRRWAWARTAVFHHPVNLRVRRPGPRSGRASGTAWRDRSPAPRRRGSCCPPPP